MTSKIYGMLGLAQRAGKCLSGVENCEKAVRSGKARLALVDTGIQDNTREKIEAACRSADTPLIHLEGIGDAVGKPGRMVCAIVDDNFAKAIQDIYAVTNSDHGSVVKE